MMVYLNNPLVAYVLLLVIAATLAWIGKHLKAGRLSDAVKLAAGTAAGLAYAYRADQAQRGLPVPSQQAAVAVGVDYLAKQVPGALQFFGKTNDDMTKMVTGELGKLLAVDPTISVVPRA